MKTFDIGPGVPCDLDVLLNTRLLVQANSGAGKSWLLRRLLEQTSGQVQQIVIDPEGEFATLRERFDYVLAAKTGGDTLADPRTAKLLAERLLELGVSAVLDIYELKAHERVRFVRLFLEALVDAPKRLWHPALVILDEAHVYAPEKGSAESLQSVIDLATRGRKRGFCLVQATQRLSKLHKDAAAEANNKLIGRSALDVDMERAGDELGLTKAGRQVLRDLDAGEFFAFGPALTRTVTRVTVGPVQTRHPKAGSKLSGVVPPPTEKVKAVLSKLADLPAEAEQREKTVAEMKGRIAELERQLKKSAGHSTTAQVVSAPPKIIEKPVITDQQLAKAEALVGRLEAAIERAGDIVAKPLSAVRTQLQDLVGAVKAVRQPALPLSKPAHIMRAQGQRPIVNPRPTPVDNRAGGSSAPLPPARQKILNGLAFLHGIGVAPADKTQLALIVGVSPTSGGYFNNLGALRSEGLIEYPSGGTVGLTEAGAALASTDGIPTNTDELHEAIRAKLPPAKWRVLEALIAVHPQALAKDQLAERIGVSPTSGGYFNNLGSLRSLGLIDYPRPSEVVALPVLFLEV